MDKEDMRMFKMYLSDDGVIRFWTPISNKDKRADELLASYKRYYKKDVTIQRIELEK